MDRDDVIFWVIVSVATGLLVALCAGSVILRFDVGFAQNQTELNKTGYVIDIDFIGGGFSETSEQTIIRFGDGDVVVLQHWKTKIPIKQNITLHYHDNGYGRCFLDNTVLREMLKEEKTDDGQ